MCKPKKPIEFSIIPLPPLGPTSTGWRVPPFAYDNRRLQKYETLVFRLTNPFEMRQP